MEDPINRRVEAHALYMTQMLERLGFSAEEFERHSGSEAAALARARCETCRASHACCTWLDMRTDRPQIDIAQVRFFCPNREYLATFCASRKS